MKVGRLFVTVLALVAAFLSNALQIERPRLLFTEVASSRKAHFARILPSILLSSRRHSTIVLSSSKGQSESDLTRELDVFFEASAKEGAKSTQPLTPAQRAERAARGVALEDELYDLRDRLNELENAYMEAGDDGTREEMRREMAEIAEEMDGLKQDYIDLVGGGSNVPIFFGRVQ